MRKLLTIVLIATAALGGLLWHQWQASDSQAAGLQQAIDNQRPGPRLGPGLSLGRGANDIASGAPAVSIFDLPSALLTRRGGLTRAESRLVEHLRADGINQDQWRNEELRRFIAGPREVPLQERLSPADSRLVELLRMSTRKQDRGPIDELEKRLADPPPEPERIDIDLTLDAILQLAINMRRLEWVEAVAAEGPRVQSWTTLGDYTDNKTPLAAALARLAKRTATKPGCDLVGYQLKGVPPQFWFDYALAKIKSERHTCNALPEAGWLIQSGRIAELRNYVGNPQYSYLHQELISQLGNACGKVPAFDGPDPLSVCPWRRRAIDLGALAHLPLAAAEQFPFTSLEGERSQDQVLALLRDIPARTVSGSAESIGRTLARHGLLSVDGYWLDRTGERVVIRLEIQREQRRPDPANAEMWQIPNPRDPPDTVLVVATRSAASVIKVRRGFGQYDEGEIAAVSDVDHDGNIEVWGKGTFGECDGEDDKDCTYTSYFRLEQFGDELGPFVDGARPAADKVATRDAASAMPCVVAEDELLTQLAGSYQCIGTKETNLCTQFANCIRTHSFCVVSKNRLFQADTADGLRVPEDSIEFGINQSLAVNRRPHCVVAGSNRVPAGGPGIVNTLAPNGLARGPLETNSVGPSLSAADFSARTADSFCAYLHSVRSALWDDSKPVHEQFGYPEGGEPWVTPDDPWCHCDGLPQEWLAGESPVGAHVLVRMERETPSPEGSLFSMSIYEDSRWKRTYQDCKFDLDKRGQRTAWSCSLSSGGPLAGTVYTIASGAKPAACEGARYTCVKGCKDVPRELIARPADRATQITSP